MPKLRLCLILYILLAVHYSFALPDVLGDLACHIVFIVRDDDGLSNLLFQTSDTTWQAYNQYGGNSLYVGNPVGRAYRISYNRPFTTRETSPEDWVLVHRAQPSSSTMILRAR